MPGPTPVERVRAQGASAALVRGVGLIDDRAPRLGRVAAFWVAPYARFVRHRGAVLAGGLAFFGLLSVVPAMISLGALLALVVDPASLAADLSGVVAPRPEGQALLDFVTGQLSSLSQTSLSALGIAGLIGIGIALYAASRFIYVGRQVLEIAFEQAAQPPSLLSRVAAVGVTLVAQLALAAALVALTVVPRVLATIGSGDLYVRTVSSLRTPAVLVVVYVLLTLAMRFGMPTRRLVGWLNVGSLLGTVMIFVGTAGLGWYLTRSATYSQIVSVLGGVVALEIWLYVVGLAVVFSAELEAVRCSARGDQR